jgi:thiol-disulfide isomerase/thioredoxin
MPGVTGQPQDGTGNVAVVKVRVRLLIGSLLFAAVASVAIGWAIARNSNEASGDEDVATLDNGVVPQPPSIGVNGDGVGQQLADVAVQTLTGDAVATSSLVGQPLVINVWSSSCVPCKKELPDFAAAHLAWGDQVRFVGLSYLPASDREEQFARDKGVQYELLYDGNGEFITAMDLAAFPVTLFVGSDGHIVAQTGQLDEAALTGMIETLLKEDSSP